MKLSSLASWIIRTLAEEAGTVENTHELKTHYPSLAQVLDYISDIKAMPEDIEEFLSGGDQLGDELQRSLTKEERKARAVNYTTLAATRLLVGQEVTKKVEVISDPFCGSARLLVGFLENYSDSFPEVYFQDVMPEAVLVALARLMRLFLERKEPLSKLHPHYGDSFQRRPGVKFDLILSNPPFTRVHYMSERQRQSLSWLRKLYSPYISGQPGLHIYALLLVDSLLRDGGSFAMVIPSSTILSDYSTGICRLLLERYTELEVSAPEQSRSFSDGSDFRELILRGTKERGDSEVLFRTYQFGGGTWTPSSEHIVPRDKLWGEWNWTKYFRGVQPDILVQRLLECDLLGTPEDAGIEIRRGIEMYGPNFFFLPNKAWKIKERNTETLVITDGEEEIEVPWSNLQKVFRKPSLYRGQISPHSNEYAIVIPEGGHPRWFQKYYERNKKYAEVARRKFGENWYAHISRQIRVKNPFSHTFLVDKFGVSSVSSLCLYSDQRMCCTKNFYFVRGRDKEDQKLLAAWINSSLYLLLFLFNRREIGGTFGRMQISDLRRSKMFIAPQEIKDRELILTTFDELRSTRLPPLPEQLRMDARRALDRLFLMELGINEGLDELYLLLDNYFQELERRDNGPK